MGVSLDLQDYGATLMMIERSGWGALPPKDDIHQKPLEPPIIFIHFTQTGSFPCDSHVDCKRILQDIQAAHMEEGASDIKFNFMVAGYGTVYEGRGWTKGAYRPGPVEASNCIDLAYIGTFNKREKPKWDMVSSFIDFIKHAVKNEIISPKFMIV